MQTVIKRKLEWLLSDTINILPGMKSLHNNKGINSKNRPSKTWNKNIYTAMKEEIDKFTIIIGTCNISFSIIEREDKKLTSV